MVDRAKTGVLVEEFTFEKNELSFNSRTVFYDNVEQLIPQSIKPSQPVTQEDLDNLKRYARSQIMNVICNLMNSIHVNSLSVHSIPIIRQDLIDNMTRLSNLSNGLLAVVIQIESQKKKTY